MKVKSSIVGLNFCLLGAWCAFADSYTISIPTGYSLIANHLQRGSNTVAEVLGTVPDGAVFAKWNNGTQSYEPFNTFNLIAGGWSDPNQTFCPGEGAFMTNAGPAFTITFQGTPGTTALPVDLGNRSVIISRQRPGVGTFENITGRAPAGDTVVYRYRTGFGWVGYVYQEGAGWNPSPPSVAIGEAVVVVCSGCPSLAPRQPQVVSVMPTPGTTNPASTALSMRILDPDGQMIAGSAVARLDGVELGPALFDNSITGEVAVRWQPSALLAAGPHVAEFTFEVAGFDQYDFNIPAQHFTNIVNFYARITPPTLVAMEPADGSTNAPDVAVSITWNDPDRQLETNSIMPRLDGSVLPNGMVQRLGTSVSAVYQPDSLLSIGEHIFEVSFSDIDSPLVLHTNRAVFSVVVRPIELIDVFPQAGSTNPVITKLFSAWNDPDRWLDTTSVTGRLNGSLLTTREVWRSGSLVSAIYRAERLPTAGEQLFEITFRDFAVPPVWHTNQTVFFIEPTRVHAELLAGTLRLTWTGGGTLQESTNLVEWLNLFDGPSPYELPADEPMKFFRVRERQ